MDQSFNERVTINTFADEPHINALVLTSAFQKRRSEDPNDQDFGSTKYLFPFHFFKAAFYRSPDGLKLIQSSVKSQITAIY